MSTDPTFSPPVKNRPTGPHRFHMDGWISCAPFERLLHMTIVEARDGRAHLTMPFLIEYAQGAGLMHGGALVSLADTAAVMAIKSVVEPQTHFATISLNTQFLKPVKKGIVSARAKLIDRVDRVINAEATVFDDADQPVLEFNSAFKIAKNAKIRSVSFS